MLKNTRDYSFLLSNDAELPTPNKNPPPRNVAVPRPEARLAQVPQKSKQLSSNNDKKVCNGRAERISVPAARQIQAKVGPQKSTSVSKPMTLMDYRKRHGSNNGSGHGRPQAPKALTTKVPMTSTEKKNIPQSAKNYMPVVRKPLPSKPQSSIPKQTLDRRRELQESSKGKLLSRRPMSSKPQAIFQNTSSEVVKNKDGKNSILGTPTESALLEYGLHLSRDFNAQRREIKMLKVEPFNSVKKIMYVHVALPDGGI